MDPSDLLEPPFNFGECSTFETTAHVTCPCFKDENVTVTVTGRKCGDWVEFNIPNIIEEVKENTSIDFAEIKISPFLPSDYLGASPRKRYFGCLVSCFELETLVLKTCPGMVTISESGEVTINPSIKVIEKLENGENFTTSNFFFITPETKGKIGCFTINISYVVNDGHEFDTDIKLTKLEEDVELN